MTTDSRIGKNLMIMNYAMDSHSQVFSHQLEVVILLAKSYKSIVVLSNKVDKTIKIDGVTVIESRWDEQKPVRNIFRFLKLAIPILVRYKPEVIFSHMTDLQSAVLAPFTRLLRIPHYLWYAHAYPSRYLRIAYPFVSGIVTSTSGSCPLRGKRIHLIGQGVDARKFVPINRKSWSINRFINVGRFDPAKKIEEIIESIAPEAQNNNFFTLEIVGSPSSKKYQNYQNSIKTKYENIHKWLTFTEFTNRQDIPHVLKNKDCFVHAFQGSLDKTLIESTLCKLPVVTTNREYIKIFGSWSDNDLVTLRHEIEHLVKLSDDAINTELQRRFDKAYSSHSLDQWISNLLKILAKS
jgi:glycosyltransferase involved in cell wall biosynthesis